MTGLFTFESIFCGNLKTFYNADLLEILPDRVVIAEEASFEWLDCTLEDFGSSKNEKISEQSLENLDWAEVLEVEELLVQ